MADVNEESYPAPNDPWPTFAYDFWHNSKYVYRGVATVDSEAMIANEHQMEKEINKM
ncbi:hypothetical protein SAMN05428961_11326 [Paenibacillus sp. OK060]|uniref:hypothetical protein n=1 Tax=Paenibacillus sp. OK060 TaxID=1881034 RepID=UPI000886A20D|nr:hypothetical protein [Paenibacillus sp. OK060]SDM30015.1 hypothetical protein SAMN05428961_11326 [Paenibacillus sp. OK060]